MKHTNDINGSSKIWPQILTIYIACLSSITNGIFFSWPSPFIVKISNDTVNYNITEDEAALFPIINPVSTIIFSFFVPALNDIIGRKYAVMIIAVPQIIAWLLTAFARNIYVFYLARVVYGLADALHYGAIPVYLGEISIPSVRGKWANIVGFLSIGYFLANLIGQNFSVRDTSYICISIPVVFLIAMSFMPESPHYCIMKNKEAEAKKALQYLRGEKDVDVELVQITADIKRQMSEQGTWKDLFLIDSNRRAVIASSFLRISQQFSGISVVQSYTQFIFEKSGSNLSSETSALIINGLGTFLTFISGPITEVFGRKKSYISSMLACALVLLLQAVYFYLDQNTTVNLESWSWFPLIGMLFYIIITALGVSPIPTTMMGELFSNSVKAKGVGCNSIVLNLTIFTGNSIFYSLNSAFGLYAPFLCFGILSLISSFLSFYLVPETKGKTLEEIQQFFKKNKM